MGQGWDKRPRDGTGRGAAAPAAPRSTPGGETLSWGILGQAMGIHGGAS